MSGTDIGPIIVAMVRWEPNTRERLAEAALELFAERGFEETPVAEIAARAGLTERTFFRHFSDKREVLFAGGQSLQELVTEGISAADPSASALDAVVAGLSRLTAIFSDERREFARKRREVVAASPELLERELAKSEALVAGVAAALGERGLGEREAALAAGVALSIFREAYHRWVEPGSKQSFDELVRDAVEELRALTAT